MVLIFSLQICTFLVEDEDQFEGLKLRLDVRTAYIHPSNIIGELVDMGIGQ